jgi:hypothetical protein
MYSILSRTWLRHAQFRILKRDIPKTRINVARRLEYHRVRRVRMVIRSSLAVKVLLLSIG